MRIYKCDFCQSAFDVIKWTEKTKITEFTYEMIFKLTRTSTFSRVKPLEKHICFKCGTKKIEEDEKEELSILNL